MHDFDDLDDADPADILDWLDALVSLGQVPQAGYGSWHDDDGGTAQDDSAHFMNGTYGDRPSIN
jgi:hypothetical protein